ncbi:hypothetical protein [Arcticibacterium luteifluviistationis]|uniref:Sensor domain-containing protein n=1 Tax=Arcticibacterium luteifluviistationis TaxID=1784714 RepID=A0A2Z4GCF7_9BACT|nr:hypothetical protein [Arcticibacterium luteifluviistationis]AWV98748.1 hypothetical protein DJ013_11420 [Arcticibacterium luteifluviistationis]
MEKSIENIWKEGFLKSDALIAPKVNNLYNQKSIHIIDKFTRMFKINLIAIVVFSFAFLLVSFFMGIPVMGFLFFLTLSVMVWVNKKLLDGLYKIDKGESSYQYLKAFSQWLSKQLAINKRMATFMYPTFFLSFILGYWFKDSDGMFLGERLVNETLEHFPDLYLVFGVPLVAMVAIILIIGILAFFGGRIYKWDLNIIYGRVFKKLEELLADLESLRA